MTTIVYILVAILIFGILIAVHELGHFLAAKACGVTVNEFSIGMGPALWKKQKGETLYALRAIPCGGFCAMEGEDEDSDDPHALYRQGFWAKLVIFAAGAFMNFVTGLLILVSCTAARKPSTTPPSPPLPTAARYRARTACRWATSCCPSTVSGCICTPTWGCCWG